VKFREYNGKGWSNNASKQVRRYYRNEL